MSVSSSGGDSSTLRRYIDGWLDHKEKRKVCCKNTAINIKYVLLGGLSNIFYLSYLLKQFIILYFIKKLKVAFVLISICYLCNVFNHLPTYLSI